MSSQNRLPFILQRGCGAADKNCKVGLFPRMYLYAPSGLP